MVSGAATVLSDTAVKTNRSEPDPPVSVSASTRADQRVPSSATGKSIRACEPGEDIPTIVAADQVAERVAVKTASHIHAAYRRQWTGPASTAHPVRRQVRPHSIFR